MVIAVCGKPGSGKTLFATHMLKKAFRRENGVLSREFGKGKFYNNVYSNYPVNLHKNIYSNKVNLLDFKEFHKWKMDSVIVLDEIQAYFDSIEFKKIPKNIAMNMQFHRHFGIDTIYFLSQDPSRIPKVFRVLAQEWYQIKYHVKIPFIGVAFFRYTIWNREEDYNFPSNLSRRERLNATYDYKNKWLFFRYKKVYKSYETKYMKSLVEDKNIFNNGVYVENELSLNDILTNFPQVGDNYNINN